MVGLMKNLKLLLFAVISAFFVLQSGCATSRPLSPTGVYAADKILYTADSTITGSYDALNAFVKWEYDNRAALSQWPEIKSGADYVRTNARLWINSAIALREVYKSSPTPDNRRSLQAGLEILRAALDQVAAYYVAHPKSST